MFKGFITALVTPFKDGDIDWNAFDNLVEWQIEQGIHGLVPCGTTGESPTLSHEEHRKVIERCIDITKKRVPIIAGTGSNATREAIELTEHAKGAGADGCLVVTPYYNKPSQAGMIAHFQQVQDIGLPVIIYNIPGRSVVDLSLDSLITLAKLPHIVGIKDATNELVRPNQILRAIGPDFCQLSGENETVAAYLAQGGHGSISVSSNVAPGECVAFFDAWEKQDMETFVSLRDHLVPLGEALFLENSPAPTKYALSTFDICSDEVRLPLTKASEACRKEVDKAIAFLKDGARTSPKLAHG